MKGLWKTYAALAVAGSLAAYIFLVDVKKPGGDDDKKEKVFAIEKSKVKTFTLSRTGGDTIQVNKDGANWKLASQGGIVADAAAVDNVLTTVDGAEISSTVTDTPAGLAPYGLEPPRLTVAVTADGPEQKMELGRHTPDGTSVYAKMSSRPRVFTIPTHVEAALLKKPVDLRDRSVLHMKRDAVKTVDLRGADELLLAKDDHGEWDFTKPLKTKAARWGVDGLLLSFENLLYEDIATEEATDFKAYGLDKPTWTAILEFGDGSAKKLEIGRATDPAAEKAYAANPNAAPPPKYYARDAAQKMVGVISNALVNDLAKAKQNLRSRYLLDFPALEVNKVEVSSGGKTRVYTRTVRKDASGNDSRTWRETTPESKDIETKTIEDLLFEVASTDVPEFIDNPGPLAKYGLDAPVIHVALTFDTKGPGWFEVGLKDGVAYGRRDNDVTITRLGKKAETSVVPGFRDKL
jgi:hypothetical protein